ncbi:MAG: hypothetical protein DRO67_09210 [Candidatus Asgardarchaeum californiense]|nr:MAG: hypothetical protein DRO67_09210 [Candidatus Asgardarchaeum californiense]
MSRTYGHSGRSNYERFERKYTTRKNRMRSRLYCNLVELDVDFADEKIINPRKNLWCSGYGRFWRPLNRWIASHVGEPWNNVYSELIAKISKYVSDDQAIRDSIRWFVDIEQNHIIGVVLELKAYLIINFILMIMES